MCRDGVGSGGGEDRLEAGGDQLAKHPCHLLLVRALFCAPALHRLALLQPPPLQQALLQLPPLLELELKGYHQSDQCL